MRDYHGQLAPDLAHQAFLEVIVHIAFDAGVIHQTDVMLMSECTRILSGKGGPRKLLTHPKGDQDVKHQRNHSPPPVTPAGSPPRACGGKLRPGSRKEVSPASGFLPEARRNDAKGLVAGRRWCRGGGSEQLWGRTWKSDVRVFLSTVFAIVFPAKAPPPEHEEIKAVVRKAVVIRS